MQAAVFAILLMTSVSAEAMEFGDRPGMAGLSSPTASAALSDDRMRRQIGGLTTIGEIRTAQSKLADRPRPISNIVGKRVFSIIKDSPGRLSQEFSIVSADLQFRTNLRHPVSVRRKPVAVFSSMRFMSNRITNKAVAGIESNAGPNSGVHPQNVASLQQVTVLALRGR